MNCVKLFALLSLYLIGIPAFLQGQTSTGKLSGIILSADGKPIENVSIFLKTTRRLTFTDNEGRFSFTNLPAIKDSLIITYPDSKPLVIEVITDGKENTQLGSIQLNFSIKELQGVEIVGRSLRSYKSEYSFLPAKTEAPLKDIPQAVSSVTKELIKDKMDFTVKDAIDAAAGVNHYSGYDEYVIRGFRAENAGNINGLRGYNTTYASAMLVNVERIEVIKGPVASLYGNGDPGGTINLVTKKPLDRPSYSIDLYGGSWNHFRALADLTGPLNASKTLLYRFNAGYDQTGSFRDQLNSKSYQIAPSLSFVPNDRLRINLDLSYSQVRSVLDRGQPGFEDDENLLSTPIKLNASQRDDKLVQKDLAAIVSASFKMTRNLSFNTGWLHYNTWQDVDNHGLKDYITEDSVDLFFTRWKYNTVTNSISNYFSYQVNTGPVKHRLVLGYDYTRSKVSLAQSFYEQPDLFGTNSGIVGTFSLRRPVYADRPVNNYEISNDGDDAAEVDDNVYHTHGIYVQDFASWGRWKLLLGLRREFYRGEGEDSSTAITQDIFTYRAGLVYALSTNASVYATVNTGFDPFETSSTVQVFNAPLKPIQSALMEIGAKANFLSGKLAGSLALYRLTVQNVAVNANDPSNPDLFVQKGENRSTGLEAELNGKLSSQLSIALSYAYCNAIISKSTEENEIGKKVENAPHHLSSSWINYNITKGFFRGFGLSLGHNQTGSRNTLDPSLELPGYFILNGGVQYRLGKIRIAAILNNIFNKTYWTSAYNGVSKWPGTPRSFMINLGYQIQ